MTRREFSAPARLIVFAVVLAAVFGGAIAVGSAFGPDRDESRQDHGAGHAALTLPAPRTAAFTVEVTR